MNTSCVVIDIKSVADVSVPVQGKPWVNKKGLTVQDFEAAVVGVGIDGTMVRVRFRAPEQAKVAAAVKDFGPGKPARIQVWPRMQATSGSILADAKL